MNSKTFSPSVSDIARKRYFFDAKGKVLGRLAGEIAKKLMGKDKINFVRHLDMGDHVVVVNAAEVVLTGRKEQQKVYHHHSGYPGGMKVTTLPVMRQTHPERIIEHAVAGMLPQNRLHDKILKHLHIYSGSEHPYAEQFKKVNA